MKSNGGCNRKLKPILIFFRKSSKLGKERLILRHTTSSIFFNVPKKHALVALLVLHRVLCMLLQDIERLMSHSLAICPASHKRFQAWTLSFLVEILLMQEYSRITSEGPEKLAAFKTLIMKVLKHWCLVALTLLWSCDCVSGNVQDLRQWMNHQIKWYAWQPYVTKWSCYNAATEIDPNNRRFTMQSSPHQSQEGCRKKVGNNGSSESLGAE